jgi:hypothetical protein
VVATVGGVGEVGPLEVWSASCLVFVFGGTGVPPVFRKMRSAQPCLRPAAGRQSHRSEWPHIELIGLPTEQVHADPLAALEVGE